MATDTYIITIEDFKNRASISPNILTETFKQSAGKEQQKYAKKILCKALYEEILEQIDADTLTPANEELVDDYLKDYLVYKIYADYVITANFLATPSGFRIQTDQTSTVVTDEQMSTITSKAKEDANYFQDELVNFLTCNSTNYPLWASSRCGCGDIRVKKANRITKIGKSKGYTKVKWT